jgi:hypothetical protein
MSEDDWSELSESTKDEIMAEAAHWERDFTGQLRRVASVTLAEVCGRCGGPIVLRRWPDGRTPDQCCNFCGRTFKRKREKKA